MSFSALPAPGARECLWRGRNLHRCVVSVTALVIVDIRETHNTKIQKIWVRSDLWRFLVQPACRLISKSDHFAQDCVQGWGSRRLSEHQSPAPGGKKLSLTSSCNISHCPYCPLTVHIWEGSGFIFPLNSLLKWEAVAGCPSAPPRSYPHVLFSSPQPFLEDLLPDLLQFFDVSVVLGSPKRDPGA